MRLPIDVFRIPELERVYHERAERRDGNQPNNRLRERGATIVFRRQQPHQHKHGHKLQDIAKQGGAATEQK